MAVLRTGTMAIEVVRRMRSVTAAAAVRATSGSRFSYATRSMTPRVENPATSARRAHSRCCSRVTPGIVEGSPMPMSMPGNLAELPAWARTLLEEARRAHLGLLDAEGAPRVLPITFAVVGADVVSAVDHKPKRVAGTELARVRWLRSDPRAALTVDRYDED